MTSTKKATPPRGRPHKDPDKKLIAYGLHLSPDKKAKMLVNKEQRGGSVRDYLEENIERDYQRAVKAGKIEADEYVKHLKPAKKPKKT